MTYCDCPFYVVTCDYSWTNCDTVAEYADVTLTWDTNGDYVINYDDVDGYIVDEHIDILYAMCETNDIEGV